MPAASALRTAESAYEEYDDQPAKDAPPMDSSPVQPKFRVVRREPNPVIARQSRGGLPTGPAVVVAMLALCLVTYVLLWTTAMRGTYVRDRLIRKIAQLRSVRRELEAQREELRNPRRVFHSARLELGMHPQLAASDSEFARLPGSEMARGESSGDARADRARATP